MDFYNINKLYISIEEFTTKFELLLEETERFEEIRKKVLLLYDDKEIKQTPYIITKDSLVTEFLISIIFTIVGSFMVHLSSSNFVKCLGILFWIITLLVMIFLMIKHHKWEKLEKNFFNECAKIDELRRLDGLFVKVQQR